MSNDLTLNNPKWCETVAACAKEYTTSGQFDLWMEANGNFGDDPKVLTFIEAHRYD